MPNGGGRRTGPGGPEDLSQNGYGKLWEDDFGVQTGTPSVLESLEEVSIAASPTCMISDDQHSC